MYSFHGSYFRFLNLLVNGDYTGIMKKNAGNRIPKFTKLESEGIKGSLDFIGINHYATKYVKDNPINLEMEIRDFLTDTAVTLGPIYLNLLSLYIFFKFEVAPLDLQKLLNYLKEEYGNPPIYIHENGQVESRNGTMADTPRV
ncbi:putative beta-glucosidase [Helianthus anomalus]